ncbi:MAG: RMD1 family protein [Clostridiales bacterium]|nr:RMD1 family protein [Clostridiales bacterium]HBM80166.1 hypothetical protein [Clostridiaceae bacterium]
MQLLDLKSTVVSNEINLNQIAAHFGINKKFKWEEPLLLNEKNLKGVILQPEKKYVYLFHFGSIVFVNLTFHEMQDVVDYIKRIDKNISNTVPFTYQENFKLEIDDQLKPEDDKELAYEINYNSVTINRVYDYIPDIISTVIAKSVALEKIEHDIDTLMDEVEKLIEFLDKGRFDLNDKQLAKMSGKILRFKYNTLSYIMLFDKPTVTWQNEQAEDLFEQLSVLFELKDRYENIKGKTEVLLDITEVFTGLTHSRRGTKLELAVIVLIAVELVLFGLDTIVSLTSKLF